jgi:hypothetical protein
MTQGKTPSHAVALHEQAIRHHCRSLKMPTVAGQFEALAQAAIREGHGHVQYLDALLTAEIEERERKGVVRRIQEARLPRTRGKTPGKEKDRQNRCNYVTLLKSNFGFCKIYLIEQITSMLHYSPIQNCYQG